MSALENQYIEQIKILGVPVSMVNLNDSVSLLTDRAYMNIPSMIFVREVASLMAAHADPILQKLHDLAYLIVPDGMPLVWTGRLRGFGASVGRVAGADLLDAICLHTKDSGLAHFFYGGKPGVAEEMARRLKEKYPGLNVVGVLCPPIREIKADFTLDSSCVSEIERIRSLNPDFIWVGISSPKQEYWMAQASRLIGRGVFVGIGAAFDFHSGAKKRAPLWMQRIGLEWVHRLYNEPRRLWRRYLVQAPMFAILIIGELASSMFRTKK